MAWVNLSFASPFFLVRIKGIDRIYAFFLFKKLAKVGYNMWDYNTTRLVHCETCGKGFRDDCGDVFCSTRCERIWEENNKEDDE
jgi:hypothetical protein